MKSEIGRGFSGLRSTSDSEVPKPDLVQILSRFIRALQPTSDYPAENEVAAIRSNTKAQKNGGVPRRFRFVMCRLYQRSS
jgi:hypothetical protein